MKKKIEVKINPFHVLFFRFLKMNGVYGRFKKTKITTNIHPYNFFQIVDIPLGRKRQLSRKWRTFIKPTVDSIMEVVFQDFINTNIQPITRDNIKKVIDSLGGLPEVFSNIKKYDDWDWPITRFPNYYTRGIDRTLINSVYDFEWQWIYAYKRSLYKLLNTEITPC